MLTYCYLLALAVASIVVVHSVCKSFLMTLSTLFMVCFGAGIGLVPGGFLSLVFAMSALAGAREPVLVESLTIIGIFLISLLGGLAGALPGLKLMGPVTRPSLMGAAVAFAVTLMIYPISLMIFPGRTIDEVVVLAVGLLCVSSAMIVGYSWGRQNG
jgi:hypothetical protein